MNVTHPGVFRISPDGVKVSRAKQELAANAFLEKQRVPHTVASDIDVSFHITASSPVVSILTSACLAHRCSLRSLNCISASYPNL